jgi:hypothetical protein
MVLMVRGRENPLKLPKLLPYGEAHYNEPVVVPAHASYHASKQARVAASPLGRNGRHVMPGICIAQRSMNP